MSSNRGLPGHALLIKWRSYPSQQCELTWLSVFLRPDSNLLSYLHLSFSWLRISYIRHMLIGVLSFFFCSLCFLSFYVFSSFLSFRLFVHRRVLMITLQSYCGSLRGGKAPQSPLVCSFIHLFIYLSILRDSEKSRCALVFFISQINKSNIFRLWSGGGNSGGTPEFPETGWSIKPSGWSMMKR